MTSPLNGKQFSMMFGTQGLGGSAAPGNKPDKSVQGPVGNGILADAAPGLNAPQYARTVSNYPLSQTLPKAIQSAKTLNDVRQYKTVKDSQLAGFDDNAKRFGSLLIATLATLGLKQKVFGINEFLGFGSWFAAMGITPRVINALIQLKTGVNIGQQYESTYGSRGDLFKDPNYLPLHILSDEQINKAAKKLGIPADAPDRRKQTEDKMRQISVQGRTWWMLVAGPATPVISGLICDLLSDPVTKMFSGAKAMLAKTSANKALSAGNADKLATGSERYIKQLVGTVPESEISMWWKDFGRAMTQRTGLKKALKISDVVDSSNQKLMGRLAQHFETLDPTAADSLAAYLESQKAHLGQLEQRATEFLAKAEGTLSEEALKRQRNFVTIRIGNAQSTLTHYESLLTAIKSGEKSAEKKLLEKPILSEVQRLIDTGFVQEAKRLVGNDAVFTKIRKAVEIRQFGDAFKLMGASPAAHLSTALKDTMLRSLWRRRILGGVGGGLLLATGLFTQFVVGRDFGKKNAVPENKGPQAIMPGPVSASQLAPMQKGGHA